MTIWRSSRESLSAARSYGDILPSGGGDDVRAGLVFLVQLSLLLDAEATVLMPFPCAEAAAEGFLPH